MNCVNHRQCPEVGSRSLSDGHLLGDGDRHPLFEGFSLSGEGCDPVGADRRISILQRAKRSLWVEPLGALVVPLSYGSVLSPSHEIAPASSASTVGFCRRIGLPSVVSGGGFRPSLVVRCRTSPIGCVSCAPSARCPLLVRRLGSGVGSEPPRSVRFRPVVSRGGPPFHHPQGVACDLSGVAPLRSFFEGSHRGGLRGQHHGSGVSASPRENVVTCPQPGGSAFASFG